MGSKNLVPRNSGEGGLGTSSKPWGSGYYDNLYVTGAAGAFVKVEGGGGGGGGSTSPGGSNTQIQFNNAGSFGGSSDLTWNGSTLNVQGGITGSAISGTTGTFLQRPSVNGSGVLLQGEAASSSAAGSEGQIQFADAMGDFSASSDLTWDGSTLDVSGTITGQGVQGFNIDADTLNSRSASFTERPYVNGSGVLLQGEATSASAGGNDTEVQYNDGGSFTGSSNFTWNNSDSSLSVIGSISGESLSGNSLDISGATPQLNIRGSSSQYIYLHHSSGAAAIGLGEAEPSMYITPPSGLDFLLGYRYGSPGRHLVSINEHSGHLIPGFSGEQDLGSADKPWRDLYIEENSIYLGGKKLSVESDQLKLNNKPVASDFSIRIINSITETDTTLVTDHLKQVHVQGNCTVTLPSDDEFKNFKTTYTATEPGIYIGFEADDGGGSITLEGKATGIGEQWDSANVYRSDSNWYIEGNNLKNASNNPSITDFSTDTITNTSIQVSITSDQTVSGYVVAYENPSSPPSENTLKASSFNQTSANTNLSINITSLDIDTAYDLYAIVLNSAEEESSISSILNVSTDSGPSITSFIKYGDSTESAITTRITSNEVGTGYILATGGADPEPNASQIKSNPNTQSFEISSADTPVTRTITSLNSNTSYQIVGYVEDNEGAESSVSGFIASTAAGTNPTLIDNGLQVRMFGWNDPYSTPSSDISTATIPDGGGTTTSKSIIKSSVLTSTNNSRITGVWNGSSTPSAAAIAGTNVTKSGIELSDSNSNFISFPQIQDNANGSFESDMSFLSGVNGISSDYGWTVTMWLKANWGVGQGPGSDFIYMPFNFGGYGTTPHNIGLYQKWESQDRPAWFGYNAANGIYAGAVSNPPDPMDDIYDEDTWTFLTLSFNGSRIGTTSDGASQNTYITLGTGAPTSLSHLTFYSGDGSTSPYQEIKVRGGSYVTKLDSTTTPNKLIDLDHNYAVTLGNAFKDDGSAFSEDGRYWPGYMSDFRIYNRVLSTGEIGQIFTGNGNY